jgi:hypothetical protein
MSVIEAKAQQCAKLREIRAALITEGLSSLDQQAVALGLSRSTAWVLAKCHHKASGLTAALLKKILSSPTLPAAVRTKVLEYIQEKAAGFYGHHLQLRRRFVAQLKLSVASLDETSLPDCLISRASNAQSVQPESIGQNAVIQTIGATRRSEQKIR